VPARAWAREVCTGLVGWQERIDTGAAALGRRVAPEAELGEARDALVDFLGDAAAATDELVSRVVAAGTPAVAMGRSLARDLRANLERAGRLFAENRTRAGTIPVDDPGAYRDAARRVVADVERGRDEVEEALAGLDGDYDVPELERAFEEERPCNRLGG
jgi:hypothetical protein